MVMNDGGSGQNDDKQQQQQPALSPLSPHAPVFVPSSSSASWFLPSSSSAASGGGGGQTGSASCPSLPPQRDVQALIKQRLTASMEDRRRRQQLQLEDPLLPALSPSLVMPPQQQPPVVATASRAPAAAANLQQTTTSSPIVWRPVYPEWITPQQQQPQQQLTGAPVPPWQQQQQPSSSSSPVAWLPPPVGSQPPISFFAPPPGLPTGGEQFFPPSSPTRPLDPPPSFCSSQVTVPPSPWQQLPFAPPSMVMMMTTTTVPINWTAGGSTSASLLPPPSSSSSERRKIVYQSDFTWMSLSLVLPCRPQSIHWVGSNLMLVGPQGSVTVINNLGADPESHANAKVYTYPLIHLQSAYQSVEKKSLSAWSDEPSGRAAEEELSWFAIRPHPQADRLIAFAASGFAVCDLAGEQVMARERASICPNVVSVRRRSSPPLGNIAPAATPPTPVEVERTTNDVSGAVGAGGDDSSSNTAASSSKVKDEVLWPSLDKPAEDGEINDADNSALPPAGSPSFKLSSTGGYFHDSSGPVSANYVTAASPIAGDHVGLMTSNRRYLLFDWTGLSTTSTDPVYEFSLDNLQLFDSRNRTKVPSQLLDQSPASIGAVTCCVQSNNIAYGSHAGEVYTLFGTSLGFVIVASLSAAPQHPPQAFQITEKPILSLDLMASYAVGLLPESRIVAFDWRRSLVGATRAALAPAASPAAAASLDGLFSMPPPTTATAPPSSSSSSNGNAGNGGWPRPNAWRQGSAAIGARQLPQPPPTPAPAPCGLAAALSGEIPMVVEWDLSAKLQNNPVVTFCADSQKRNVAYVFTSSGLVYTMRINLTISPLVVPLIRTGLASQSSATQLKQVTICGSDHILGAALGDNGTVFVALRPLKDLDTKDFSTHLTGADGQHEFRVPSDNRSTRTVSSLVVTDTDDAAAAAAASSSATAQGPSVETDCLAAAASATIGLPSTLANSGAGPSEGAANASSLAAKSGFLSREEQLTALLFVNNHPAHLASWIQLRVPMRLRDIGEHAATEAMRLVIQAHLQGRSLRSEAANQVVGQEVRIVAVEAVEAAGVRAAGGGTETGIQGNNREENDKDEKEETMLQFNPLRLAAWREDCDRYGEKVATAIFRQESATPDPSVSSVLRVAPERLSPLLYDTDGTLALYNSTTHMCLEGRGEYNLINAVVLALAEFKRLCTDIVRHFCHKDFCLACELGLLWHMMRLSADEGLGFPCRAKNLLLTFKRLPEARQCQFIEEATDPPVIVDPPRQAPHFMQFLLEHLRRELDEEAAAQQQQQATNAPVGSSSQQQLATSHEQTAGNIAAAVVRGLAKTQPSLAHNSRGGGSGTQRSRSTSASGPSGNGNRRSVVRTVFAFDSQMVSCCSQQHTKVSTVSRYMLDLPAPAVPPPPAAGATPPSATAAVTIGRLIEASVTRRFVRKGHCSQCRRLTRLTHEETPLRMPPAMILNYQDVADATIDKIDTPPLPVNLWVKLGKQTGGGVSSADQRSNGSGVVVSDQPVPGSVAYTLTAVIAEVREVFPPWCQNDSSWYRGCEKQQTHAHLVTHLRMLHVLNNEQQTTGAAAGESSTQASRPAWVTFNGFVVTYESEQLVRATNLAWKRPALLIYANEKSGLAKAVMTAAVVPPPSPAEYRKSPLLEVCWPFGASSSGADPKTAPPGKVRILKRKTSVIPRLAMLHHSNLSKNPNAPTSPHSLFQPLTLGEILHIETEGFLFAFDAEFVAMKPILSTSTTMTLPSAAELGFARLSVVRAEGGEKGVPCLDVHIRMSQEPADYLTQFSGLKCGDLSEQICPYWLTTRKQVYQKLRFLVDHGCTFIGHGLAKDLATINLYIPRRQLIDTVHLFRLPAKRMLSLRYLAYHVLHCSVQSSSAGHDSVEDATVAMRLFDEWRDLVNARCLQPLLHYLYRIGLRLNWQLPASAMPLLRLYEAAGASADQLLWAAIPPGFTVDDYVIRVPLPPAVAKVESEQELYERIALAQSAAAARVYEGQQLRPLRSFQPFDYKASTPPPPTTVDGGNDDRRGGDKRVDLRRLIAFQRSNNNRTNR